MIGIGGRYRYCFIYRLQRSFSLFGFRPVGVWCWWCCSICCVRLQSAVVVVFRRDVQFICLPLLYFPWPPLLDVSKKRNIKIQRSRRFTCLSTEVLQTACLLQKVPILRKKELPACSALWWLSALLRGNDTLSRAGGIFLWR